MHQAPKDTMYLPFTDPRKRGLVRFAAAFFWLSAVDSILLAGLGTLFATVMGLAALFKGQFSSAFTTLAFGAVLGGLVYYQYKLLQEGTSPFKKWLGMQVLKYDPALNGYRKCTPAEFLIRDVVATFYFPVAFMVLSIPAVFGAALSGGMTQAAIGDDSRKHELIREMNQQKVQAATAAGAAAGVAVSFALVQKFPWLLALHDSVMKTMVVNANKDQAKYFANGGVFETGKPVKPFSQAA